jgi:hypothetical protein
VCWKQYDLTSTFKTDENCALEAKPAQLKWFKAIKSLAKTQAVSCLIFTLEAQV